MRQFRSLSTRVLVGVAAVTAPVGLLAAPASASPARAATAASGPSDRTSPLEAKRVDSVPTPKIGWYTCQGTYQCGTVDLPLDYDQPKGAKVRLAVLKVPAKDQKHRIGTLFVNPGGPGGSGVQIAAEAPYFLDPSLLARFDVVGFDPRGINYSDNLRCFANSGQQAQALGPLLDLFFPWTRAEETAFVASGKALGRACSTRGRPLSGAMSTAEVVRDMEVLRRAVGDRKLTYLGFSYGTAIGQYYANMFPDRFRAIVVDGVIDPEHWVGTRATQNVIQDDRLRSADGAWKALHEILVRCDKVGGTRCAFAAGDPVKNLAVLAARLKAKPLTYTDPQTGETTVVRYSDMVGYLLLYLYSPGGYNGIVTFLAQLYTLSEPPAGVSAAALAAARSEVAASLRAAKKPARDFPYANGLETYAGVACTDGLHPRDASVWPRQTDASDRRAPYFGKAWAYSTVACGRSTWTVRDEDAYTGPWNRRTAAPVLLVGNFWDPATAYTDAQSAARRLPNSRLLSSDSWGHTAYGTSACVTNAVDAYLLAGTLPKAGTLCRGDVQPFGTKPAATARAAGGGAKPAPVAVPSGPALRPVR